MKLRLKRYKWYLIGGTSFLAVLLVLAVIVYINMTPTLGKDATNADKIFDFLDKWASAGAPAIMLLAILVALCVGLAGIRETRNIQKREQRQRLLDEITQWGIELQTASLEIDNTQHLSRNAFVLTRYAIGMSKNEYIRAIANESFKADLAEDVENIHRACIKLATSIGEASGVIEVKYPPTGDVLHIKDKTHAEISQKTSETGKARIVVAAELRDECEIILADGIERLLVNIGKVKAKLLTS